MLTLMLISMLASLQTANAGELFYETLKYECPHGTTQLDATPVWEVPDYFVPKKLKLANQGNTPTCSYHAVSALLTSLHFYAESLSDRPPPPTNSFLKAYNYFSAL